MINLTFQERVDFFMERAGTSYRPETQSEFAGTLCQAMDLAAAERWVHTDTNYEFNWERDNDSDGDTELWVCMLVTALGHGDTVESCGAIPLMDCGPDAHYSDPYQRVIEAELAAAAMAERDDTQIAVEKFHRLTHQERLDFYDQIDLCAGIEIFINHEVLRALCMWNDPNGDYDECTHADLVEVIQSWREEK